MVLGQVDTTPQRLQLSEVEGTNIVTCGALQVRAGCADLELGARDVRIQRIMVALSAGLHENLWSSEAGVYPQTHRSEAGVLKNIGDVGGEFVRLTSTISTVGIDHRGELGPVKGDLTAARGRDHDPVHVQGIEFVPGVRHKHAARSMVLKKPGVGAICLIGCIVEAVAKAVALDEVLKRLRARGIHRAPWNAGVGLAERLRSGRVSLYILLQHGVKGPHAQRVLGPVEEVVIVVEPVHPHAVELEHQQRLSSCGATTQAMLMALQTIEIGVLEVITTVNGVASPI